MKKMMLRILIIISVTLVVSCCGSGSAETTSQEPEIVVVEKVDATVLGRSDGGRIIIDKDIDLKGRECKIPSGMILSFKKGVIKNGILNGNMTRIECKGKAFDKVTIKGSWNVPEISTRLFADLSYENSLRDVVALAHPNVQNKIVIEKGDYKVRAEKKAIVCIPICSNTDFILKGTISLAPNDLKAYDIVQAEGGNISIKGNGTIVGDKQTHTGTEGEWGMGINLKGAVNARISGLTIKDCWGDCIYVGGSSKNVLIEKCILANGRRQGISVTKASGVTIRNCMIKNVSGTNPQYAIDIEPNSRDSVDNILIENVEVKDCVGGLKATRGEQKDGTQTPWIGTVTIRNCNVKCSKKYPIRINRCEKIEVNKCKLYAPDGLSAILVVNSGEAKIKNNYVSTHFGMVENLKNKIRDLVGKGKHYPISIMKTKEQTVLNNKIISK